VENRSFGRRVPRRLWKVKRVSIARRTSVKVGVGEALAIPVDSGKRWLNRVSVRDTNTLAQGVGEICIPEILDKSKKGGRFCFPKDERKPTPTARGNTSFQNREKGTGGWVSPPSGADENWRRSREEDPICDGNETKVPRENAYR